MAMTIEVFESLIRKLERSTPATVMTSLIAERAFSAPALDQLFDASADRQYTKELLFSLMVKLMLSVVTGINPSVNQAIERNREEIQTSKKAVYEKLAHMEPGVSEQLVMHVAHRCTELVEAMPGALLPSVFGAIPAVIVDGNAIAASERRLAVSRNVSAAPMPGKAVVLLDPQRMLIRKIIAEPDGHASEISRPQEVIDLVPPGHCIIADRLYCTRALIIGWIDRSAYVLVRENSVSRAQQLNEPALVGSVDGDEIYEQEAQFLDEKFFPRRLRRIVIELAVPTRDKSTRIVLLTNLPSTVDAMTVAQGYRSRWTVEKVFGAMDLCFNGEITSLAQPRAALFALSVACCAFNVLSTLKASIRSAHGTQAAEELSEFAVTTDVASWWNGARLVLAAALVGRWNDATVQDVAAELLRLATAFNLRWFRKAKRGPKKPKPKLKHDPEKPHVSTHRLLQRKKRQNAK